jgi:hypothetical protein
MNHAKTLMGIPSSQFIFGLVLFARKPFKAARLLEIAELLLSDSRL